MSSKFLVFNRTLHLHVGATDPTEAFRTLHLFWSEWEHEAELVEVDAKSQAIIGRIHRWPLRAGKETAR